MTEHEGGVELEVLLPDNKNYLFKNLDAALDFLKWSRPAVFQVVTGYTQDGQYVVQITMENNSL